MLDLHLTDEQVELLVAELDRVIDGDRYPLSARIRVLREIGGGAGGRSGYGFSRRRYLASDRRRDEGARGFPLSPETVRQVLGRTIAA